MANEWQKKEDLDLHYLKVKIISLVGEYNNRAEKLETSRKSNKGNYHINDIIPKYSLCER